MIVANGSTSVSTYFVLRDSTNHAPKTDVAITDIDLYYQLPGAAQSAKVDAAALAAADSAWDDNKAYHCGNGLYRIDWPNTCFDGGVGTSVYLIVVCTGVDTTFLEVQLSPQVNVNSLTANVITEAGIADNAFANEHFAAGALTSAEITSAAGCAVASIANNAITTASINDGAITEAKIADDVKVDVNTIKGQTVTCAAGVTVLAQVGAAGAPGANNGLVTTNGTKVNQTVDLTAGQSIACSDKTGFSLAATGADLILKSSTFVQAIVAAINEFATYGLTALNTLLVTTGIKVGSLANNAITAAAIATDAIDADAIKTDALAEIADAVWDEAIADHVGAGSTGKAVTDILADTNELQADDTPTAIAALATTLGAAGAGLTAVPWNAAWDAEVQSECTDALNAYDPPTKAELDSAQAAVTVAAIANNAITAAAIATDAIDADALKADAITEIQSGLATAAALTTVDTVVDLIEDILRNKMEITDANGNLVLYADDSTTPLYSVAACVTDDLTTTTRKRLA